MKLKYVTINTVEAALKEFIAFMDLHYYVDYRVIQDYSKHKAVIEVRGNFKTIEDILDECWENNSLTYCRK